MQSASDTPLSHLRALWRCALCSAAATAGRPRHKRVVAERSAKGGLGCKPLTLCVDDIG